MHFKKYEDLTLADNFMFCKVFTNYPKQCKRLVEVILGRTVARIEVLNKEQMIDSYYHAKSIRLDVYLEDGKTVYDFEMQAEIKAALPRRSRYYQSQIDTDALNKGTVYQKLKDSYIVFICLQDPFEEGRCCYTFRNRCDENSSLTLNDGTWKVFLNANGTPDDTISEELRDFLRYLAGKLPKGEEGHTPFVRELEQIVEHEKNNEEWRRFYMTAEMDLYFRTDELIEQGREEGLKEGRKEGRDEGRKEGLKEGRNEGIQGAVGIYREEMHLSDDEIIDRIVSRFHLTKEEALKFTAIEPQG